MIEFQTDIKYQLTAYSEYYLQTDVQIEYDYVTPWYGVDKRNRMLWANVGMAWDGATLFPDFDWILEASLWHDILHYLIGQGAIREDQNHAIDRELARAIQLLGGPESRGRVADTLLKIRAGYVRRATHLAKQKHGEVRPIYQLAYGKRTRIR